MNPLDAVTVIVEVASWPASTAEGELEVMMKSGGVPKVKVALAPRVKEPLVAVIATVNVPVTVEGTLHDRVAVPEPVTVPGLIAVQDRPEGSGVSDSATVPPKPFCPVTVIIDVATRPAGTDPGEVAVIVKSTKLKVAVAE